MAGSMALPGASGEENQHGEDFQTACQHGPAEHQFAQITELTEIAGRTHSLQTGTDVVEGAEHGREIGSHRKTIQRNNQKDQKYDHHVSREIGIGVVQDLFIHNTAVVPDDLYPAWIEHFTDIPANTFQQEQQTGNLQTAAGGAGTGANHHQT